MFWPWIEKSDFCLPSVLAVQVAHRPVIFDPRNARLWPWHFRQIIPSAKDILAVCRVYAASPLQSIWAIVVLDGMKFRSNRPVVRPKFHAIWRIGQNNINDWQQRQNFPTICIDEPAIAYAFLPKAVQLFSHGLDGHVIALAGIVGGVVVVSHSAASL